jgi:hypothetical protein
MGDGSQLPQSQAGLKVFLKVLDDGAEPPRGSAPSRPHTR